MNSSSNVGAYGKQRLGNDSAERIREQTKDNQIDLLRKQISERDDLIEDLKNQVVTTVREERAARLVEIDALSEYILSLNLEMPDAIVNLIAARIEQIVASNSGTEGPHTGKILGGKVDVPEDAVLTSSGGHLVWLFPDGSLHEYYNA